MAAPNVYVVRQSLTNPGSTGPSLYVQSNGKPLKLLRAACWASGFTTPQEVAVQIARYGAAPTVTAFTPLLLRPADAAAKFTAGYSASTAGTIEDVDVDETFNVLSGWLWTPARDLEEPEVTGSAIATTNITTWAGLGILFPSAPPAGTYKVLMHVQELG